MKKIKWGIIGLGDAAHQFAQNVNSTYATLTGAASRSLQKSYEFSVQHDIKKAYGSYEELVYDPEIDSVYIAKSVDEQYDYVLMALKAGKHVLCDNSITQRQNLNVILSLAESKHLLVAAAPTEDTCTASARSIERISQTLLSGDSFVSLSLTKDTKEVTDRHKR